MEQILPAMPELRHQDPHPWPNSDIVQGPLKAERMFDHSEVVDQHRKRLGTRSRDRERGAHEELAGGGIVELVGCGN
ncbi:hypothetical protein [Sphingomonas glacialis]|uniref:hypothetical protein n=1 Tax=Sphingomonas glacialis TaxID=658225 RepID=UPI0032208663